MSKDMAAESNSTVTLLLSTGETTGNSFCLSELAGGEMANGAALVVTFDKTPDAKLRQWADHWGRLPPRLGIVAVGEETRAAARAVARWGDDTNQVHIETVRDTRDLTGIGIAISESLTLLAGGDSLVVCVDSLAPMLAATDERRTFRFLHVLTRRLKTAGADAHVHFTTPENGERTVAIIRSLFDDVVRVDDE